MCSTDGTHTQEAGRALGGDSARPTDRLDRVYEGLKRAEANECAGTNMRMYAPLFVSTCIALCVNPESAKDMHANFVAAQLKPQLAVFDTLIEAGIVERLPTGTVRVCAHEALRIYVNALCRVQLPFKQWVMR